MADRLTKRRPISLCSYVSPQGDWTEEEHDKFLDTARKYGVGDKWGLFASHVGTRVGYQCSAYYTQVRQGLSQRTVCCPVAPLRILDDELCPWAWSAQGVHIVPAWPYACGTAVQAVQVSPLVQIPLLRCMRLTVRVVDGLCMQVILPSGMILDARYRLGGSNGKAAFVG